MHNIMEWCDRSQIVEEQPWEKDRNNDSHLLYRIEKDVCEINNVDELKRKEKKK